MILLANGWHPDVVAKMQEALGGTVNRVGDCTWIKTKQNNMLIYEVPNTMAKQRKHNERRQYPLYQYRWNALPGEDCGTAAQESDIHQAP